MWTHKHSIETTASATRIWELFRDVAGWKSWNSGIEQIEIHGPFAAGTHFTMQLPDGTTLTSRLVEVEENQGFTDETWLEDTRVLVRHELAPLANGGTTVTYSTQVTGPDAEAIGGMATSDFPDVLLALKTRAENSK